MAPVAVDLIERRGERRRNGGGGRWHARALLRPGQPVTLLNINSHAALVESLARLRPGAHTEIQLAGAVRTGAARTSVRGRLERCFVSALEPLRYRGVIVFDQCVDIGDDPTSANE